MAEESNLPQQIRAVERSVVFLRQEHLTLLHGLHLEILSLQKRCSGEDDTPPHHHHRGPGPPRRAARKLLIPNTTAEFRLPPPQTPLRRSFLAPLLHRGSVSSLNPWPLFL